MKVYQPHKLLRLGWVTETEKMNGWKVVKPKMLNFTPKRQKKQRNGEMKFTYSKRVKKTETMSEPVAQEE